jgi:hypothetical protein
VGHALVEEARRELLLPLLPGEGRVTVRALTHQNNGYRALSDGCPKCGQEVRVDLHGDRIAYTDRGACGCDVAAHLDEDKLRRELRKARDRERYDGAPPVEELAGLLELPAGLTIASARTVGHGSRASADITFSDGSTVTFDTLSDFATPNRLAVQLGAAIGVAPILKRPEALRALVLLRAIAEREETASADDIATEWGTTYLQAAEVLAVNMDDQADRWAAFERLNHHDPWVEAKDRGCGLAHAGLVLAHVDDARFVRTGWFSSFARSQDATAGGNADIAQRMERVGWRRRGQRGRVKATRPDFPGQLAWSFFVVEAGWEETDEQG